MRARSLTWMLALVAVAACGAEPEEPEAGPSPAGFTPSSGQASVSVTGDVEGTLDMTLADDVRLSYGADEDATALSFVDPEDNRLTIAGTLTEGENPTSPELQVDLSLPGGVFMAADDQCVVTVHRADEDAIEGEIGCADLSDDGERAVNAVGSFSATP